MDTMELLTFDAQIVPEQLKKHILMAFFWISAAVG